MERRGRSDTEEIMNTLNSTIDLIAAVTTAMEEADDEGLEILDEAERVVRCWLCSEEERTIFLDLIEAARSAVETYNK